MIENRVEKEMSMAENQTLADRKDQADMSVTAGERGQAEPLMQTCIKELSWIGGHPALAVKRLRASTEKKLMGCFPVYAPEELIYGAGMLPVGMWGGQSEIRFADRYVQSFCCSIMRQNLEQGIKGTYRMLDGILIPIYCDTLKCLCENWKIAVSDIPLLPMVYPQNRRTPSGMAYLQEELRRVLGELEGISGRSCTQQQLREAFHLYEECRSQMRRFTEIAKEYPVTIPAKLRHWIIKASYFMDKREYTEKLRLLTDGLLALPQERETFSGSRVVLTGILAEPDGLLEIMEDCGLAVAADDLAQESRQFRTALPPEAASLSTFEKIVHRFAAQGGCALLFEEQKTKGQLLTELVKQSAAEGVVVCMMKFCDPEEFDYPVYRKELEAAGIPLLYMEIEQRMDSMEQLKTRLQGFSELLQVRKSRQIKRMESPPAKSGKLEPLPFKSVKSESPPAKSGKSEPLGAGKDRQFGTASSRPEATNMVKREKSEMK